MSDKVAGGFTTRLRPPREESVFDDFDWWDERDVLTQITPARLAYIRQVVGSPAGRMLLDLGCGGGMLAEPLARLGAGVTGLDISANALRVARAHACAGSLEIAYLQARAEQLPFPDGTFDLVMAFDVLEHLERLPEAIGEVSRVLRAGGKVVYDTMNRTLLTRVSVIWIGENLWKGGPPKGTHDWRKFIEPRELVAQLDNHGIANVETRGFSPVGVDLRGRLRMAIVPWQAFSYVGYGVKRG